MSEENGDSGCSGEAELREGVSKAGKPYKGIFCKANKDHVKWLPTT